MVSAGKDFARRGSMFGLSVGLIGCRLVGITGGVTGVVTIVLTTEVFIVGGTRVYAISSAAIMGRCFDAVLRDLDTSGEVANWTNSNTIKICPQIETMIQPHGISRGGWRGRIGGVNSINES